MCAGKTVRHLALQPAQFRRLHLRRDDAADIIENGAFQRVDLVRIADGAVVHPHDDIPIVITAGADGHRPALLVHHDERAGRVEPDTGDIGGSKPGIRHRRLHAS
ncbi:hypothetical protein D3C80_989100 [compost metagenome]